MPEADPPLAENCQRCGSLRLRSVQAAAFPNFRGGTSLSTTEVGTKCACPERSRRVRTNSRILHYFTEDIFVSDILCYMKCVLFIVDAPGPAEFIAPVIPLLKGELEIHLLSVKSSPTEILQQHNPTRCDTERAAERYYTELKPEVLVTGMSSLLLGPFVVRRLTELAERDHVPILCFQDYWANHRHPQNKPIMRAWNTLLVPDELAKQLVLADGFKNNLIVTGNPAFEKFRNVNVGASRLQLRRELGVNKNRFVILYAGTGTPQSAEADERTFQFLSAGVRMLRREMPDLIYIARAHPRDEHPTRYKELAPDLKLLNTDGFSLADDLLPLADVVVSMYSTNLIHACFLRIPAVSILLREAGTARLRAVGLSDFPPNTVGATVGIHEPSFDLLLSALRRIRDDSMYRNELAKNQEAYFPFHKDSATVRVAEAIRSFIA